MKFFLSFFCTSQPKSYRICFTWLKCYIICEVVFPVESVESSQAIRYGGKITESAIAKVLNMSNGPVREAITRLRSEGWIKTVGNRGSFLVDFSDPVIARDIYKLRLSVETGAFYTLAASATQGHLEYLANIVGELEKAKRGKDVETFRKWDIDFHMAVIRFAGGEILSTMVRPKLLQWYAMIFHVLERLNKTEQFIHHLEGPGASSHESILKAIAKKDSRVAARSIANHYRHLADMLQIDKD